MQFIRDMVFIKSLERQIGRSLTEDEMSGNDDFKVMFPDGRVEWIQIPLLSFPYDLISNPSDLFEPEVIYLENAS